MTKVKDVIILQGRRDLYFLGVQEVQGILFNGHICRPDYYIVDWTFDPIELEH